MSIPEYRHIYTDIHSQESGTDYRIRTENKVIIFDKFSVWVDPESIHGTPSSTKIETTQRAALQECYKDQRCKNFVENLLQNGYILPCDPLTNNIKRIKQ